jgi:hypothetical protein
MPSHAIVRAVARTVTEGFFASLRMTLLGAWPPLGRRSRLWTILNFRVAHPRVGQPLSEIEFLGGPPFALNLGCHILDDFQGWGFSARYEWPFRIPLRQSLRVKIPILQKLKDGTPKTSKPSVMSGPPADGNRSRQSSAFRKVGIVASVSEKKLP